MYTNDNKKSVEKFFKRQTMKWSCYGYLKSSVFCRYREYFRSTAHSCLERRRTYVQSVPAVYEYKRTYVYTHHRDARTHVKTARQERHTVVGDVTARHGTCKKWFGQRRQQQQQQRNLAEKHTKKTRELVHCIIGVSWNQTVKSLQLI